MKLIVLQIILISLGIHQLYDTEMQKSSVPIILTNIHMFTNVLYIYIIYTSNVFYIYITYTYNVFYIYILYIYIWHVCMSASLDGRDKRKNV